MEKTDKAEIKAIKARTFDSETQSLNPSFHPVRKIDTALYEDILSRSEEFGIGSVLAERLSVYDEGATLLDYFAGIAMSTYLEEGVQEIAPEDDPRQVIAKDSYDMARAMLEAREETLKEMAK